MKVDVKGGRVLLVIGDGAVARVAGSNDTKAVLVAVRGSKLQIDKNPEPMGASFTNGAALDIADTDSAWLVDALRFLGFTLRKRKPLASRKRQHEGKVNK